MKTAFWKKDWFLGLLVPLAFFLAAGSTPLRGLEWGAYDLGMRFSPARPANENLVVVAADDASLEQLGAWPWSREVLGRLSRRLGQSGVAVTGYVLPLEQPQNAHALEVLADLARRPAGRSPAGRELLQEAQQRLNTDRDFAASLRQRGAVLLAVDYEPRQPQAAAVSLPALVAGQVVKGDVAPVAPGRAKLPYLLRPPAVGEAGSLYLPVAEIARAADGLGHALPRPAQADAVRAPALVLQAGDRYLPSFALLVTAHTLGLDRGAIVARPGHGVQLADVLLSPDPALRAFPFFYREQAGKPAIPVLSASDVLAGKVPAQVLRDKTVLVGVTAPGVAETLDTPIGPMPAVVVMAHTVSSLLNRDLFRLPEWGWWAQAGALVLTALYLMFVLGRFRLGTGIALSALVLVVLLNTQYVLMLAQATWVPLAGAMLALILGHMLLGTKWKVENRVREFQGELSESNRQLGLSYQSQGQLDHAFDKYRRCAMDDSLCAMLYNLGLDYERKRQFSRAAEVFRHIARFDRKYRDVNDRIGRNEEMENMFVIGGKSGKGGAGGTLIISSNGLQKPMLGRYQVERELGRGAMGMVYLGRDPKIGRTVAIKTMALSQEFEGEQLEDIKRRFFREAETAGRLNHPNIVTIYDVGEEQDLAYIAMDYLKGENLLTYGKPETLLPAGEVFDIVIEVAEALDYAHEQGVVHRDIKPANIIYDAEARTAKVTDFGVAHLVDSSKTKTGTILGSPSYMSPEQLAGNRVDGRSDLFSLGITYYQLLTGELPFIGESLASLMYKIANEKHPDVRMFRPDLPSCVSSIVNKALHKEAERRFQSGSQFASALRKCRERLEGGRS